LLEQSHQLLFARPLAPMRQRGAIERQLVTEAQFTAEELIIGVFNPARAQHLVRQVMHVLLYSANRGQALSDRLALLRGLIPPGSRFFSIRPTAVKRFRTVLRCDVDLSLRVLASLRNRTHRPFHDGIRRTKWNNLQGVLCAHEAQGTAHAPNSLRPSSREGQLSASTRNRKLLLLVRSSITGLFALRRLHFPCPAEIRAAHPDAMQDDRQPP